jgi:hypothetical protein
MKKFSYALLALFLFVSCQKEMGRSKLSDEMATKKTEKEKPMPEETGKRFVVMLSGANEVPGPGDPDGTGVAELFLNQGQGIISYKITTSNLAEVVGAHIHRASVTEAGPIVIHLMAVANGTVSGVAQAEKELIKEIRQHPEMFYVNVHTIEHRPGAIRGQLAY